jgi:5-(aminomethyl)-3-furanmethanol phosphate kinase
MSAACGSLSILKLGGSLLSLPDVGDRLISFVEQHQIVNPVVVVGGGDAADLVRVWTERFELSDPEGHDLALQAMTLNAQLLSHLNADFSLINAPLEGDAPCEQQRILILQCQSAAARLEAKLPQEQHIPKSWDVTSDSIAAWFATSWEAERLYLLKSADMPAGLPTCRLSPDCLPLHRADIVRSLTQRGFVDRAFARFAATVPSIAWCNLRQGDRELRTF